MTDHLLHRICNLSHSPLSPYAPNTHTHEYIQRVCSATTCTQASALGTYNAFLYLSKYFIITQSFIVRLQSLTRKQIGVWNDVPYKETEPMPARHTSALRRVQILFSTTNSAYHTQSVHPRGEANGLHLRAAVPHHPMGYSEAHGVALRLCVHQLYSESRLEHCINIVRTHCTICLITKNKKKTAIRNNILKTHNVQPTTVRVENIVSSYRISCVLYFEILLCLCYAMYSCVFVRYIAMILEPPN